MPSRFVSLFAVGRNLRALTPRDGRRLDVLDAVRVVAFAYVVLHHCAVFLTFIVPFHEVHALLTRPGLAWVLEGELSVDLFFALSGFLITELLLREHRATGSVRIGRFYVRRFLRLAPALYVMLVILYFVTRPLENAHNLWANAIWVNNFLPVHDMGAIWTWSLAIEEQFYLTFPLLLLLVLRLPGAWPAAVLAGAIVLNPVVVLLLMHAHELHMPWLGFMLDLERFNEHCDVLYDKLHTRYGAILVGALIAWLAAHRPASLDLGRRRTLQWALLAGAVAASAWLLHRDQSRGGALADALYSIHHPVAGLVAGVFIVLALQRQGLGRLLARWLPARVFMAPSHLTYVGYLMHMLVIRWYYQGFGPWPGIGVRSVADWSAGTLLGHFAVVLVLTYAVSLPIYLLVERPCMNLRDLGRACPATPGSSRAAAS